MIAPFHKLIRVFLPCVAGKSAALPSTPSPSPPPSTPLVLPPSLRDPDETRTRHAPCRRPPLSPRTADLFRWLLLPSRYLAMADVVSFPPPPPPMPAAFLEFLKDNGLDPTIYSMADAIPRYIRVKPGMEISIPEIERELKCHLKKVSWLPGFYAIPPEVQIAGSKAYQQGKIYGIDAASGAAILALDVQPGDHVLDLCAAPGAKLCMLADMLGSTGSLTGVDVAKHRLAACRTMLQKYSLGDRCRLFVADGTSFSILPVNSNLGSGQGSNGLEDNGSTFPEWTSKRSWKDRQKSKKAKAAGLPHPALTSEPELIYYGKDSGLVGLCKCDVLRSSADDEAGTSGYDKVFRRNTKNLACVILLYF